MLFIVLEGCDFCTPEFDCWCCCKLFPVVDDNDGDPDDDEIFPQGECWPGIADPVGLFFQG